MKVAASEPRWGMYVIDDGVVKPEIEAWWSSLPAAKQAEWLEIEKEWQSTSSSSKASLALSGVSRDWVEEHGGKRSWWDHMRIYPIAETME